MEVSGQIHAPIAFTCGESPRYVLDRRLSGSQSESEPGGEEKNSHYRPCREFKPDRPVRRLVYIPMVITKCITQTFEFFVCKDVFDQYFLIFNFSMIIRPFQQILSCNNVKIWYIKPCS
jgi:hypothetical protein